MAFLIGGEAFEKLETLMSAAISADAGMRLINDHKGRARPGKFVAATVSLDIVQADDSVRISFKQALSRGKTTLQAACPGRGHGHRVNVKLLCKLTGTDTACLHDCFVVYQREAVDQTTVEHLADDQSRLDRLADPDIVGDQQPHHREL